MEYGINTHALIPCRAEPSHRSELVTQLLFGECYSILDRKENWIQIRNEQDQYLAWIDSNQHVSLSDVEFQSLQSTNPKRCGDIIGYVNDGHGRRFAVPCGSILPHYSEGIFKLLGERLEFEGRIARNDSDSIMRHARRFIGSPYLWGGKSAFGIDCSGFTQIVFACAGIKLLRDAYQQAQQGDAIADFAQTRTGDLAFFQNDSAKVTHVGIVMGNGDIIHSSGTVRIDSLTTEGIRNQQSGELTHRYHSWRRIKANS